MDLKKLIDNNGLDDGDDFGNEYGLASKTVV